MANDCTGRPTRGGGIEPRALAIRAASTRHALNRSHGEMVKTPAARPRMTHPESGQGREGGREGGR